MLVVFMVFGLKTLPIRKLLPLNVCLLFFLVLNMSIFEPLLMDVDLLVPSMTKCHLFPL